MEAWKEMAVLENSGDSLGKLGPQKEEDIAQKDTAHDVEVEQEEEEDTIEAIRVEQQIFLRAALQLLLEKSQTEKEMAQNAEGAGFRGANGNIAVSPSNFHTTTPMSNNSGIGQGKSASIIRTDSLANENLASTSRKQDSKYMNHDSSRSLDSLPPSLKSGFVKKASGSKMMPSWKTKMVDVRPGLLIYEDEDGLLGQRNTKKIVLDKRYCVVQDIPSKKNNQFGISSSTDGSHTVKRQWMATNESEKEEWINKINSAMIPDRSEVDDDSDFDYHHTYSMMLLAPYIKEIERYKEIKLKFSSAEERQDYMEVVSIMCNESLMIPTTWLQMVGGNNGGLLLHSDNNGAGGRIALANFIAGDDIEQMWKDMKRDRVSINGSLLNGDCCGPEAIVGMLTRAIMDTAKTAKPGNNLKTEKIKPSVHQPISLTVPTLQQLHEMTEVQALIYTITILLAGNRTSSGGNTYLAVEHLCRNSDLVIVCPYSQESDPLQISVSLEYEEEMEDTIIGNEDDVVSSKSNDEMKKTATDDTESSFTGSTKDQDTYIPDLGMLTMKDRARATQSMRFHGRDLTVLNAHLQQTEKNTLRNFDLSPTHRRIKSSSASIGKIDSFNESDTQHARSTTQTEPELTSEVKATYIKPTSKPMINTTIIANSYYKVCPNDPQDENDDLWCIIAARFCQTFTISAAGLDSRPEQVFVKVIEARGQENDRMRKNSEEKESCK